MSANCRREQRTSHLERFDGTLALQGAMRVW